MRLLIGFLLAALILVVVGVPARTIAGLYAHLDALSANVRSGELEAARGELDQITGYYETGRAWGFQWLADYLFADAFLQRAAHAYLLEDYDAVIDALQTRVDDPRASFLLGCARFRLAERRYHAVAGDNAKAAALKTAIVQEIIEVVNQDFERAVRADQNDTFSYKWNYDLTSDADALERALAAPPEQAPEDPTEVMGIATPGRRRRG
jgi:hypothetical protein